MTENEAIKVIKRLVGISPSERIIRAVNMATSALEEIQQYRVIETELREQYHANVDIKTLMKYFIETVFKGERHEEFCILTNEDAKMWREYREIGTVEEFKEEMERKRAKKPILDSIYHQQYYCPNCEDFLSKKGDGKPHHCICGQAIDWSETTE